MPGRLVSPNQDGWNIRLPCCELEMDETWNAAPGNIPILLNHGKNPRTSVSAAIVCRLPAARDFEGRVIEAPARAIINCLHAAKVRIKASVATKRQGLDLIRGKLQSPPEHQELEASSCWLPSIQR